MPQESKDPRANIGVIDAKLLFFESIKPITIKNITAHIQTKFNRDLQFALLFVPSISPSA